MNTYYPIHILVAVPCPPSIRDRFSTQFGSQCHFTFINSSQTIPESLLRHTDVIIGEPDEPDLLKAPRLKWLQLTWAGADKYARMKRLHCIDHFQFIHIIRQLTLGFHLTIVARFTKKQS